MISQLAQTNVTTAGRPHRSPLLRFMFALVSLPLPGAGHALRGQGWLALFFFLGSFGAYMATLAIINDRFGVTGEMLGFSFLDGPEPVHLSAEIWFLLVLGLTVHVAAVWDATRRP